MADLFNVTHDANNLNEYDSITTDGGDLSTGAPGLGGTTAKMEAFIDDTNTLKGAMSSLTQGNHYRVRLYVNPNGLTMAASDQFNIHWVGQEGGSYYDLLHVDLFYSAGGDYYLILGGNNDADGWPVYDDMVIADAEHYVELHVVRASSAVASDGTVQWWVDGVDQGTHTGIDNYNLIGDHTWISLIGARFLDAGTSGTLYLDEFRLNNDGSEIGAVAAAADPTAAMFRPKRKQHHLLVR